MTTRKCASYDTMYSDVNTRGTRNTD